MVRKSLIQEVSFDLGLKDWIGLRGRVRARESMKTKVVGSV